MHSRQFAIFPHFEGKHFFLPIFTHTNTISWVETKLQDGDVQEVRQLLTSDHHLFNTITSNIESGQAVLAALSAAATGLMRLREALQMTPRIPLSSIWVRAAFGELSASPLVRETLLSLKKVSSDKLAAVLTSFKQAQSIYLPVDISSYQRALSELLANASAPLRTEADVRINSVRTTVVAQKVELSKHKAALSEQDKAYSELIARLHDDLENYFESTFIDPKALFLEEILIYDLRSPHTEVFQPKPRFAIERALGSPHDYLGCECCAGVGGKDAEVLYPLSDISCCVYTDKITIVYSLRNTTTNRDPVPTVSRVWSVD